MAKKHTLDVVLKRSSGDQQLGGTPETLERIVKLRLVILKSMRLIHIHQSFFYAPHRRTTGDSPHQRLRLAI